MTYKELLAPAAVLVMAIVIVGFTAISEVRANPLFFLVQNNGTTVTASTSVSYMSVGAATTTYYMDTAPAGSPGADYATLIWQMTASSSNSTQDLYLEYAQGGNGNDCIATPLSCDWYSESLLSLATSSVINNLNGVHLAARWKFTASTTQGFNTTATSSRSTRTVTVPTPMRYVRAIFVIPGELVSIGQASSSAVWAAFVARKQAIK